MKPSKADNGKKSSNGIILLTSFIEKDEQLSFNKLSSIKGVMNTQSVHNNCFCCKFAPASMKNYLCSMTITSVFCL